jgi:hypothetical protein
MINYDIPWNPVRLEQRMGRIHRYGQEFDCLIFNFVTTNTREGRVLEKLFERIKKIEDDLDPQRTGKVFNVLGEVFAANQLEKMVRDMYAHNQMTEELIKQRIVEQVDPDRFRSITNSTLEGLAKRELNLSAIVGKSAEAKERRLVPEVIEQFFLQAAPITGLEVGEHGKGQHTYRVPRVPRSLWATGERLEPRFGKLGREYKQFVFDKEILKKQPTFDWVTPGHPLFETVREDLLETVRGELERGAVFFDVNRSVPARLAVYSAAIRDGLGHVLHRRLFIVQEEIDGTLSVRQPTLLLDLIPAPKVTVVPGETGADQNSIEHFLVQQALEPFLAEVTVQREKETQTVARHLDLSLNELILRQNIKLADLLALQENGDTSPLLAANTKQAQDRLDELFARLEGRHRELEKERNCTISDIKRHATAWVLPHPDRANPGLAAMVRDDEIERIAVDAVIAFENARGYEVESVEQDNRGFDLISRRPHPEDAKTAIDVRFIEVKGRAGVGEVALSGNEYRTAQRLKKDYWLYVVFNCGSTPAISVVRDPAQLDWQAIMKVEHYQVKPQAILNGAISLEDNES